MKFDSNDPSEPVMRDGPDMAYDPNRVNPMAEAMKVSFMDMQGFMDAARAAGADEATAEVTPENTCGNCQAPVDATSKFCAGCGARLLRNE